MKAVSDDRMLDVIERETFGYFVHEANEKNGLVRDNTRNGDWPASIAAVGLALAAYPVGVERGFMSRKKAAARTLVTLDFLVRIPQGKAPHAAGYKGFFFHFLGMKTGRRAWKCELSTVDTALLIAGALTSGAYFDAEDEMEKRIRLLARKLYEQVDWSWALHGGAALSHGWRPETGFLPWRWIGYSEALLLYVLALGSPTHPIPVESYAAFVSGHQWRDIYGIEYLHAGPLFIHQLAHLWIDFRGLKDSYMREKGIDYFENSRRATLVQQEYAIRNPNGFAHYGRSCWGITASDGPGPARRVVNGVERTFYRYVARGVPDGPDDGTIAPWSVAASIPFAPEIVVPTLRYFIEEIRLKERHQYGFEATFNGTFPRKARSPFGWVSPWVWGLNEGPVVAMIENHRTGLIWNLMRKSAPVVNGLRRAGFAGGWL
jgi:hypothetical protein